MIGNGLDRTMRINTEYGLDMIMMTNTDSPRLAVTPGEWYASDMLTPIRRDLRQMNGIPEVIGVMYDCRTVWGFPQIDFTVVDCGAVELDDLTFRRPSFPQEEFSAGRDRNYMYMEDYIVRGFPKIDSAAVDYDTGAVEQDDLMFRRASWRLYMAGPLGWFISAHSISDWVTPFRITSQTWPMLSLVRSYLPSLDRECGCSAVSSSSTGSYPKRISRSGNILVSSAVSSPCMARWRKRVIWVGHVSVCSAVSSFIF